MKTLIAKLSKHNGAQPLMYCLDENGELNPSITNTLLAFVTELPAVLLVDFSNNLAREDAQKDWSLNDISVRFIQSSREVSINNCETGHEITFTFSQVKIAIQLWSTFSSELNAIGKSALIDQVFKTKFP